MNAKTYFSSRKGFTLIELLVVIGILAVLAAIAIPSVAGLIDRSNVSADKTNANEMTNAVERFTSEYELYCQDIASGAIKDADSNGVPDDMDAAQGRVFNVTGAVTRANITALESTGLDGMQINRDTKYPVNAETMQAIVENYTKTSSATFAPKQSDMHYWYSPDCGVVVYATPDADVVEDLNSQIQSGMDAKGNPLGASTQWIDLTLGTALSGGNAGVDVDMSTVSSNLEENDWATVQAVIKAGKINEAGWKVGDISPEFTIDGKTRNAILIGINQDGANTATFMIQERVGVSKMRETWTNDGGFGETIVSEILNDLEGKTDIAQYMVSVNKNYYYEVFSDSNYKTGTDSGKLFLLSLEEVGLMDEAESYGYRYLNVLDMESSFVYEYFQTDDESKRESFYWIGDNRGGFWLRSSETDSTVSFFGFDRYGDIGGGSANSTNDILPAFVIG